MGDEVTVKRAEKDLLKSMDLSNQSDEENRPPKKKKRLVKEKKEGGKAGQKKGQKGQKKAEKKEQKSKNKAGDLVLDLRSPPKQPNTQIHVDGRLHLESPSAIQQKSSPLPSEPNSQVHHSPVSPLQPDVRLPLPVPPAPEREPNQPHPFLHPHTLTPSHSL